MPGSIPDVTEPIPSSIRTLLPGVKEDDASESDAAEIFSFRTMV